jgi:hypothetical protein
MAYVLVAVKHLVNAITGIAKPLCGRDHEERNQANSCQWMSP